MRVLVLHSQYLSGSTSGENRVVEDEVELLRCGNHDVATWTPSVAGMSKSTIGLRAIWSSSARSKIGELLAGFQPDVVHVHNLFPALSPAVLSAVGDVPLVMTLHNYRLACLPATLTRDDKACNACIGKVPWRGVVHGCYRGSKLASGALAASITGHRLLGSFDRISLFIAVSDYVRRVHIQQGVPVDRIAVRPNFTHPVAPREGPGSYFLYVGRLSSEKGIAAFARNWQSEFGRLVVVGDGPARAELLRSAGPTVEVRDAVPGGKVPGLLRDARAVVVPSTSAEGSPRIICEAYAAGVPVIASRVGALPEIVTDGETGLLVEPHDEASWAKALRVFRDDRESLRMGRSALNRWATVHAPEPALAALERLYATAVSRGAGDPALRPAAAG